MSPESLPVKLRQARGAMTLPEAADRSGVPEDRIRMYEEGDRQPYAKTLRRLARAYGVSVSDWMGADAESRPAPPPRRTAEATRQRRRRPAVAAGNATLEIPVEFAGSEPVRLVFEVVLRPPNGAATISAAAVEPADVREDGDDSANADDRVDDRADDRAIARNLFGSGPPARESSADRRDDAPARPRRRIAPHVAERLRGERVPHSATAEASARPDPLDEFRRAYSQFRQSRVPGRDRR